MDQQLLKQKTLPSFEGALSQMLKRKFNINKDDLEPEEWKSLMTKDFQDRLILSIDAAS